jgi:hypothetical protein
MARKQTQHNDHGPVFSWHFRAARPREPAEARQSRQDDGVSKSGKAHVVIQSCEATLEKCAQIEIGTPRVFVVNPSALMVEEDFVDSYTLCPCTRPALSAAETISFHITDKVA